MQVVQLVDVADVHLLFVQLGFVEVLTGAVGDTVTMRMEEPQERVRGREGDCEN